jgi:hypothetical protein
VADYVIATFPDESPGEPQDGVCADYVLAEDASVTTVDVPADVQDDPNFPTSVRTGRSPCHTE